MRTPTEPDAHGARAVALRRNLWYWDSDNLCRARNCFSVKLPASPSLAALTSNASIARRGELIPQCGDVGGGVLFNAPHSLRGLCADAAQVRVSLRKFAQSRDKCPSAVDETLFAQMARAVFRVRDAQQRFVLCAGPLADVLAERRGRSTYCLCHLRASVQSPRRATSHARGPIPLGRLRRQPSAAAHRRRCLALRPHRPYAVHVRAAQEDILAMLRRPTGRIRPLSVGSEVQSPRRRQDNCGHESGASSTRRSRLSRRCASRCRSLMFSGRRGNKRPYGPTKSSGFSGIISIPTPGVTRRSCASTSAGYEPQPQILFSQFLPANDLLDVQERGDKRHPIIRMSIGAA